MRRKRKLKRKATTILKKFLIWIWNDVKNLLLFVLSFILLFQWLNINVMGALGEKLGAFGFNDKLDRLQPNERAKLTVNVPARRAHVQTQDGKIKTYRGVRKIVATELTSGEFKLRAKNLGVGLEPGLVMAVGDGLTIGPDVEFAYWKNFALAAGFTVPVHNRKLDRIRGHFALTYMPGLNIIPNTGVFLGVDSSKNPIGGVRIRF